MSYRAYKSDSSLFPTNKTITVNFTQEQYNRIGVVRNADNSFILPQGTYLITGLFPWEKLKAGQPSLIDVNGRAFYVVGSGDQWTGIPFAAVVSNEKLTIAACQVTGESIKNVGGTQYCYIEITKLA